MLILERGTGVPDFAAVLRTLLDVGHLVFKIKNFNNSVTSNDDIFSVWSFLLRPFWCYQMLENVATFPMKLSNQVGIWRNKDTSFLISIDLLGLCISCCAGIEMRRMAYRLGESPWIVCCVPGAMITLRTKLRLLTGIKVNRKGICFKILSYLLYQCIFSFGIKLKMCKIILQFRCPIQMLNMQC